MISHRYVAINAFALAIAATLPTMAPATTPTWKTIQWQYYVYGYAYDGGGSPTTCTVKLNNCRAFYRYFNVDPTRKSITFNYSPSGSGGTWSNSVGSLPPTINNGIAINLLTPRRVKIQSVTIDAATNMAGFDSSHLSFTEKQIQVDWHNLGYNSSTIVKLDVTFAADDQPTVYTAGNPPRPLNAK